MDHNFINYKSLDSLGNHLARHCHVELSLEASIAGGASVGIQCVGEKFTCWAILSKDNKPWTHHCLCGKHLTCTPTGQSCEGTKGGSQPRLDPCPIKASVGTVPELVVMVLVVEPVRVKASKGSAS